MKAKIGSIRSMIILVMMIYRSERGLMMAQGRKMNVEQLDYETGVLFEVYNSVGETAEDNAAFQLGQVIKSRGWNSRI